MTSTSQTPAGTRDAATASIGLTGLAVMGRNLARNIARHGHTIAVHNRTASRMTSLLEEYGDEGDFVGSETPRGLRRLHPAAPRRDRDGEGRRPAPTPSSTS